MLDVPIEKSVYQQKSNGPTAWQFCILFGHVGLGNVATLLAIDIFFSPSCKFVKKITFFN